MSSILDETSQGSARQSLGGLPHVVDTLVVLRQVLATDLFGIVTAGGGTAVGDGNGGTFWWNPADTTADNGTTVIRPSIIPQAQPGRWNLLNTQNGGSSSGSLVISTGSTTARTLADRFCDIRNVADFGAVSDGVTDNSPFFQAAADNLPASGGILFVRAGASPFIITAGIRFTSKSDVTIISNGAIIKVQDGYVDTRYNSFPNFGYDSIFRFVDGSNITIEGITLDANIQNRTAHVGGESFNSCLLLMAVNRAEIRFCKFINGMTDGITVMRNQAGTVCSDISVRDCTLDSNRRNNLSGVDQNRLLIDNCVLTNAGASQGTAPMSGIDIEPDNAAGKSKDVTIRTCTFDGNRGTYALSIGGKGTDVFLVDNCTIHISKSGGVGINCDATISFASTNGVIRDCVIDSSTTVVPTYTSDGIRAVGTNVDRIYGCEIYDNIVGVAWFDADGGIVEDNYFEGNGVGVSLGDVSDPCIRAFVRNNTFIDNTNINAGGSGSWFALTGYPASADAIIMFSGNYVENTALAVNKADGAALSGPYKSTCHAFGDNNTGLNLLNTYAVVTSDFKCSNIRSLDGVVPFLGFSTQDVNFETALEEWESY